MAHLWIDTILIQAATLSEASDLTGIGSDGRSMAAQKLAFARFWLGGAP